MENNLETEYDDEEETKSSEREKFNKRKNSITMYMRFKKELKFDNEGNHFHIDYLLKKF
jgi:hypothetical protein